MTPYAPPKPCHHPGCPALTYETYCPTHKRAQNKADTQRRGTKKARGYSGAWVKLRRIVLSREPLCRSCKRASATEVDHIKPKAQGGTDAMSNLQGLCKPCHSRKTRRERGGGVSSLEVSS